MRQNFFTFSICGSHWYLVLLPGLSVFWYPKWFLVMLRYLQCHVLAADAENCGNPIALWEIDSWQRAPYYFFHFSPFSFLLLFLPAVFPFFVTYSLPTPNQQQHIHKCMCTIKSKIFVKSDTVLMNNSWNKHVKNEYKIRYNSDVQSSLTCIQYVPINKYNQV